MIIGAVVTMVFFFAYSQVKNNQQNLGFSCGISFCLVSHTAVSSVIHDTFFSSRIENPEIAENILGHVSKHQYFSSIAKVTIRRPQDLDPEMAKKVCDLWSEPCLGGEPTATLLGRVQIAV